MPRTSPTKSGTKTPSDRKLSDVAKHLVLPSGIAVTGYPAVQEQCRRMGVVHDDWQRGFARAILAKRATGLYAAGIGGVWLSTCRQVGKTYTIATVIFALCILEPGQLVLWTAHHSTTTDETFEAIKALTQLPLIKPFIDKVREGNGKQRITFRNGSRILFGAREHGFGRGIPGVTIIAFDEAQILSARAVTDMVPASGTVKNPLVLYMGTPPAPHNNAEVFKARRRKMLGIEAQRAEGADVASNTLYVEIGADRGADPHDRVQWRKGNPSYPGRTPEETILRLEDQLPDPASFLRDGLGIWDDDAPGTRLITADTWKAAGIPTHPDPEGGVKTFGVTFSIDGDRMALAGALRHTDSTHVELIDAGSPGERFELIADWLAARWRHTAMLGLSGRAGATAMQAALIDRGVPARVIHMLSTTEYYASCALAEAGFRDGQLTRLASTGQHVLDMSVECSDKHIRTKDGAWGWASTVPGGDETPVEAVSVANWAARTTKRRPGRQQTGMVMT